MYTNVNLCAYECADSCQPGHAVQWSAVLSGPKQMASNHVGAQNQNVERPLEVRVRRSERPPPPAPCPPCASKLHLVKLCAFTQCSISVAAHAARQRRHSFRSSFARVGAGAEHKALAVLGTHAYAHVCSTSHADCVQFKIPGSGWSQSTSSMPDVHQVCYCRRIRSVVREHGL